MSTIKEIWKKLKVWHKWGIVFGILHILFLTLTLILCFIDPHGMKLGTLIPEFIPIIMLSIIGYLTFSTINFGRLFNNIYLYDYVIGTIMYTLLGMLLGYLYGRFLKEKKMKRILSFVISLTLILGASEIFAYHPPTHSLITEKALSGSRNYQEFKKAFGKDGDKKLIEGTVQEDYPFRRAVHLFLIQ